MSAYVKKHVAVFARLLFTGAFFLTLPGWASDPLWNGAGSVTNNNFSNTNNWVVGTAPIGNSINGLPVNFGPLTLGGTNTANCDASGNSLTWTFNAGMIPMFVTLNSQQLGAATGPDILVNNSTNLQTVNGTFRLFDIGGTTTSRRFNGAVGPLGINASQIQIRGDSAPSVWALEFGGASGGTFNSAFNNVNYTGTLNYLKTGAGTWEIISALPNITANASALTVLDGTLTLDAANTFRGATTVGGGAVLNVTTFSAGAGTFTVSNSATLGVALASSSGSLTNSGLNLGTTGADATTLNFDFGNFTSASLPLITVNGAFTINGNCTVNITNGFLPVGQFPLIKYGSLSGGGSLTLGVLPAGVNEILSNNVARSSFDLVIYASLNAADVISWNGNLSAVWDINSTANWKNGLNTGLLYTDTNEVVLDDSATGNFAITLNSAVSPMSLTVAATNNYSISGSGAIAGGTVLVKSGSGVLTLNNTNAFLGPTTVAAGALVLNNLNALAADGSLTVANGAVVQPKLPGTYSAVPTIINGVSTANGSFGGALDFHSGGSTTATWPGPINLNSVNATIGSYGVTYNVTLSGQLTGIGGLTFRPEGGSAASHTATFVLSNPTNNYSGSTTMQVGTAELNSTLKLGVNNGLPTGTALNLNRAGSSGAVYFDLAGYTQTVTAVTANFSSNAVINSSSTIGGLIVSNAAARAFAGVLGVTGRANFSFTKLGAGSLTIGGPNNYSGNTIVGAGTLVVTNLITATSGLVLSNNATLLLAVGGLSGATNIWVNGNVTLAGVLNLTDAGIVSNTPYPVIYYSGTLNTNGLTLAPLAPWTFTVDTSVPHVVRLLPTQQFPLVQFTNGSFSVTTLTTNLGGILRGIPLGPIWYEVRDQTNKLWDFGAAPGVSPWSITVRHLRSGTNTVTIYGQNGAGVIQSNSVQLTLTLGPNTSVRPRPIPSEIWWGGISDNTSLTNYTQWPFVQKFQDGYFLHSAYWSNSLSWLLQSLSQNLLSSNTKFWPELAGDIPNVSTNSAASELNANAAKVAFYENNGIILSELTHDYHMENMQPLCQVNPSWLTNDDIAWWTGDLSIADGTYPYTNGIWSDIFKGYYARFPHVKVGETSQPEWWPWGDFPAGVANSTLAFTITNSSGQNINFSLNASNILASFVNMAGAIGYPYFALQSDSPWDYFGGGGVGTVSSETTMRQMIRAYEKYFQSRGGRHSLICNVSNAGTNNQGSVTAADNYYEVSSLNSMYLHQQEGGRANRYLYESWYWGIPYAVVPETQSGTYTHLALSAIKYLKGIADTNGSLEQLNITALATNGTMKLLQLQNNGDVQCLPALAAQAGTATGVTTRYFTTNGTELTAAILTGEGLCFTNMLQPGASTNLFAVTLATGLTSATNDNGCLEAFWNPQDPLGVVRDRETFSDALSPRALWSEAELGNVGVTGGSALSGTNFTLLGGGADVWGTADAGHFLWQANTGDGTIIARVTSQINTDPWSKAGVMIRESSAAGAKNVFLCLTPNNGVSFQNRPSTGGSTYNVAVSGPVTPYWLRLTRSGAMFTAQYSANGSAWTTLGTSNLTGFASTALWGMAVTAHNNAFGSAANFDNVTLPNAAPVLDVISNRTITAGQTLSITNMATDANVPPQTLTYSLQNAPTNAVINASSGLLAWRPLISQSPSTNPFSVVVTDNGVPPLSATQGFSVTVLRPENPLVSLPSLSSGVFTLRVSGDTGPDYILQAATNLVAPINWRPLITNFAPGMPFNFTDSATSASAKFYRVQVAP